MNADSYPLLCNYYKYNVYSASHRIKFTPYSKSIGEIEAGGKELRWMGLDGEIIWEL